MKPFFAVLLTIAMLLFIPASVLAQGNLQSDIPNQIIISPMYVYFISASCNLTISGSGSADMDATAQCVATVNKIRVVAYLQKYSGGSWQNIESWSQYYYSNTASWSQSENVESGYNYRLYVYFYAYKGTILLESVIRSDTYQY